MFLKELAANNINYFYFSCECLHSFKINGSPHNLMCLFSEEVKIVSCCCVAGQIGLCNHILTSH